VGANEITVVVTAEDGTTIVTYTITVTRAEEELLWGDVDESGEVEPWDAFLLNMRLVGHDVEAMGFTFNRLLADVFHDGILDGLDLLMLQLSTVGHDVPLGPGPGEPIIPPRTFGIAPLSSGSGVVISARSAEVDAVTGYAYIVLYLEEVPADPVAVLDFKVEFDPAVLAVDQFVIPAAGALPINAGALPDLTLINDYFRLVFVNVPAVGMAFAPTSPGPLMTIRFEVLDDTVARSALTLAPQAVATGPDPLNLEMYNLADHSEEEIAGSPAGPGYGHVIINPSDDATLSVLEVNGASVPGFTIGLPIADLTFTLNVLNVETSVVLDFETSCVHAPHAVFEVEGDFDNLIVGANTVTITVTAEDGTTVRVYTITVNRAAAPPVNGGGGQPPQYRWEYHDAFMFGYNDNFRPSDDIMRAEVAAVLVRTHLEDFEDGTLPAGMEVFDAFGDVDEDAWYFYYIAWAYAEDLIRGYGGNFRPGEPITREELAAVMARTVAQRTGVPGFTDASAISDWAVNYVYTALREGWMLGDPDGRFRPGDDIIRAEVATAVNRMLGRTMDLDLVRYMENARDFPDVDEDAWYFVSVLTAANDHRNRVRITTGDVVGKYVLAG
jgi:PKD repeat protein